MVRHQGDVLNCDLTETNTTHLDPYDNRHFLQSSTTDIYQLYYKHDGSFFCDKLNDKTTYLWDNKDFHTNIQDKNTDLIRRRPEQEQLNIIQRNQQQQQQYAISSKNLLSLMHVNYKAAGIYCSQYH